MFGMNHWSIRRKLTAASTLTTSLALLVACGAFATYDILHYRRLMVQRLSTNARMLADSSTAAVTFENETDAEHTLALLRSQPLIEAACVYDASGKILARYFRDDEQAREGLGESLLPRAAAEAVPYAFTNGDLLLLCPIEMDGRRIGSVFIRETLDELYARMRRFACILVGVLAGSVALALWLISKLQRFITYPIEELSTVARRVSTERDYALRARKTTNDELGVLIDGFNEMLSQIQARDAQLHAHRAHLEEEVASRTAELRTTNVDLTTARDRAEEASRAKSAFLANMSHEIRTPMTAILGYADVMLEPNSTLSDRQDCLQVIRRNARHLMELINDILDISKIEAEKMTVEKIPTDLPQLVIEVVSMIRPKAMEKDLMLTVDFDGPIPREVKTDALRLKQILMNLIGNAIKFTARGVVRLRVSCDQAADSMRFDICDSGIGMTPDQIAGLFRPFTQADESMTRKYGGTGLGLVISKRLAVLLGGDVSVMSQPGIGSTFSVVIAAGPLQTAQMLVGLSESILAPIDVPVESRQVTLCGSILLAEDGQDNQCLISMHLTRAGATVVIAENGRIAVDLARKQDFDVILMDMQMPVLDGYGAASELRSRGFILPIIALTAHAMSGDREKCLAAGCTDYLTKPIEKDRLLSVVNAHMVAARGEAKRPAELSIPPQAPSGELVRSTAEDSEMMRQVLAGFVGRLPSRVTALLGQFEARDDEELQRTVHQLKGAGTGYGLPDITRLAVAVEQSIKQGAPREEVSSGVDALVRLLRRIEGYDVKLEVLHAA